MKGLVLLAVMIAGFSLFTPAHARAASRRALLTERVGQILPLEIEGQSVDLVWIYPSLNANDYLVEATVLLEGLQKSTLPDVISRLRARVRPPGVLSVEDLRSEGVLAHFDETRAVFMLTLAAEAKLTSVVDLMGQVPSRPREIAPKNVSGYLNWRIADEINAPADQASRHFVRGDVSSVLSMGNVVLESGADYDASAARSWTRQDTRLVHEDFDSGQRWELGDLTLRATAFQVVPPQAGVSFARSRLGPTRTRLYKPYGETQILLKRPSRVEVLTGETAFAVVQAPAGPLELRNLPIAAGAGGELKLRITDDLGTVEVVSLDTFFSGDLLSLGESDFELGIGAPMRVEDAVRVYDSTKPIYTGFYNRGIARGLSLGFNLQGQSLSEAARAEAGALARSRHFIGVELKVARTLGVVSAAVTGNLNDGEAGDVAALVSTQIWPFTGLSRFGRSLYASVAYRGRDFKPLDPTDMSELARWSTDLTFAQNLGLKNRLALSSRRDWYETRGARESASFEFERFIGGGRFAIGARSTRDLPSSTGTQPAEATERTVYARLTLLLGGATQTSLEYDSASQRFFGSFSAQNASRNDGHVLNGVFENQVAQRSAFLSHRYLGERLEFFDEHQVMGHDGVAPNYVGRLGLGGSLAFAGGTATVGRRISDSFAIVSAPKELSREGPEIRASSGSGIARFDGWGPTLLPSLSSGLDEELVVDETVMPEGTIFRDRYFHLRPRYKSGFALELELLGVTTVTGTLVNAKGEPLALASGEVKLVNASANPSLGSGPGAGTALGSPEGAKPSQESQAFFTNGKGRFVIEGLAPGKTYEIELYDEGKTRYQFSVAPEQKGLVRLPSLKPLSGN